MVFGINPKKIAKNYEKLSCDGFIPQIVVEKWIIVPLLAQIPQKDYLVG